MFFTHFLQDREAKKLPVTDFGPALDEWLVQEVVTRRGTDGWFRVCWSPMRVKLSEIDRFRAWDGRAFSGPETDLQDGTVVLYFADTWLPAEHLSPEWVAYAEASYHFLCPACMLAFPSSATLRTHWDQDHAAADNAVSLRARGLRGVATSRARDLCAYFRQCLRVKLHNKIRCKAEHPE